MSVPVVALIGRPNVGKSALFNRIIGDDAAIVSEEAGTTRDRHFARAEWNGRAFWLVDTGGISDDPNAPMDREIRRQVALEPRLRERAGMAEDAGRGARHHQRAPARGIAGGAGERGRNAVVDDRVRQ